MPQGQKPEAAIFECSSGAAGVNYTKEIVKKIEPEKRHKIYPQRLAIVEPVSTNVKIPHSSGRCIIKGSSLWTQYICYRYTNK
jgi:hypothetical protein